MDEKKVNRDPLSARQLSVAVLMGGLSWVGGQAGRIDWRWALAALPLGVVLGWLLIRRVNACPLFRGVGGGVLAAAYGAWALVLLSCTLRRTAGRILHTGGSEADILWVLLLLTLPLIWIGFGKAAAFFRMAEVLWLVVLVVLAALLIFMLPKVNWAYLAGPPGDWQGSMLSMLGTLSTGLVVLPYLYKVEPEEGNRRRGLCWLAALGGIGTALTGLVAGVLSPGLAAALDAPFFAAVGVLGDTARLEGLISALWLLPDLILMGLLAQTWGRKPRPAIAAGVAMLVALTGATEKISAELVGAGGLVLVILIVLIPTRGGKIVVPFS